MIFRRTARSGSSVIWRIGALLAATLLPLAIMAAPVANAVPLANATPRAAACPPILFLGAHGLFEGSAVGGTQANTAHWGSEVETVWEAFSGNGVDATAEAVNFPEQEVDLPKPWGNGLPEGPTPLATLVKQVLSLESGTNAGAQSLVSRMWDTYLSCGSSTSFVLAGYSQGAWLIDIALRQLAADGPVGKAALANTKAVFLMGDPAWPPTTQDPNREGLATWGKAGYSSSQAYLANGVKNFRSMCVSYPGGNFDPVCLGLTPVKELVQGKFVQDICLHFSYGSEEYGAPKDPCLGAADLSNGIAVSGGNWLATQIGGSAG